MTDAVGLPEVEVVGMETRGALALFGPAVRAERRLQELGFDWLDLRREWQRCFEAWLTDTASSGKTLHAYTRAWNDLWIFLSVPTEGINPAADFWNVTHQHIRAWASDLATRELDARRQKTLERRGTPRTRGYAQSTIGQFMAAISSFYSYAENNWPVTLPDGREVPLMLLSGMTLNPVGVIKRRKAAGAPKTAQAYLSTEQLRRFLNAIPRDTVQGLRDRALFTFYVMTGARNSEVRTLQWQDFRETGGRLFWHWRGKGRGRRDSKDVWKELPPECWEALQLYLKAVGRLEGMTAEAYVFTALTDRAGNLPSVSGLTWKPYAQPLSEREVNRLLKLYAHRAGLDSEDVHVHTLRHSAAMLMDAAGADVEEIRHFLNHESLTTTQGYMHKMKGERNVHAARMAELLQL